MKHEFDKSSEKLKTVKDLISYIRTEEDPAAIDAALLSFSKDAPFYPEDQELYRFFIEAKGDPLLDQKILKAAKFSAPLREDELLKNRISDKQGAFIHFIYPDLKKPRDSKIFKVIRAGHVGGGTGGWGGLKEDEDIDPSVTVNREVYEEVIDAVKFLINVEAGADAADMIDTFDAFLEEAALLKEPLSEGVRVFIENLLGQDVLKEKMEVFVKDANDLISGLLNSDRKKLFQCRDDAHAIQRGWGFKVDAFGHIAELSKETADKFEAFQKRVHLLQEESFKKGKGAIAGEMRGVEIYTLEEAFEKVKESHYGHEGLAEIIGFSDLVNETPTSGCGDLWENFLDSGAVDALAEKMRLTSETLYSVYVSLVRHDRDEGGDYLKISDRNYKSAKDLNKIKKQKLKRKP